MTLNTELTMALAEASLAAYLDFERKAFTSPANFKYVLRLTGWDPYSPGNERFGLIFQGSQSANRSEFIVALRGTDSLVDILDDALADKVAFTPYRGRLHTTPRVHHGFYDTYSLALSGGSALRKQVFDFLDNSGATQVYATGHSLGAALAQLFTLDFRISSTGVPISSINFASPMVGGSEWASACKSVGADTAIARVINYWDYVPDYPMFLSYVPVGAEFRTAFSGPTWSVPIDELPRHSLVNLTYVLTRALPRTPQVWAGTFTDRYYGHYDLTSTASPRASKDALLANLQALKDAHQASRDHES